MKELEISTDGINYKKIACLSAIIAEHTMECAPSFGSGELYPSITFEAEITGYNNYRCQKRIVYCSVDRYVRKFRRNVTRLDRVSRFRKIMRKS